MQIKHDTIEHWPTSKPIPYARNPRKISEQAIGAVAGSIKEFGFRNPIIVDGEGVIINGHTRLRAAQQLGLDTVPVIIASDLTPSQARAYRLSDNRVAEFTEWDAGLLEIELADIGDVDLSFADFGSMDFTEEGAADGKDNPYTTKVETPIYKPTGDCPPVAALCDESVAAALLGKIEAETMPSKVRYFLQLAACRHYKFNYKQIAEYYSHAPAKIQQLMEESALVIVDFKQAIELGFVKLAEETAAIYASENPNE